MNVREPLERAQHTDLSAVVLRERSPVPVAVGALGLVRDLEDHLTQPTDGLDTLSVGGLRTAHSPALERDADLSAARALRGGVSRRDGPLADPRPAPMALCFGLGDTSSASASSSSSSSSSDVDDNREALNSPEDYLRNHAHRSWNQVRDAYKNHNLKYVASLGPQKDGTFNSAAAETEGAGMNMMLAYRLHTTLLKGKDQGRMDLPGGPSLMQSIAGRHPTFDWNYGAGTESATSDIDSNLSGDGTEAAVLEFNDKFRREWGREPGTVFDVNVYARDYLPSKGSAPLANQAYRESQRKGIKTRGAWKFRALTGMTTVLDQRVEFEVPLDPEEAHYAEAMKSEEAYALLKVRMEMSPGDWTVFKDAHRGTPGAGALLDRVDALFDAREAEIQTVEKSILESRDDNGPDQGQDEDDLRMRAQNMLYAKKLETVAQWRQALARAPANPSFHGKPAMMAGLTDALHQALIFANESYITGAAVQHVVLDKQMLSARQKDPLELLTPGPKPKNLKLQLTPERYLHSFHEQIGFIFREFELYKGDSDTALLKASKYIYRLGNAAKHIVRGLRGANVSPNAGPTGQDTLDEAVLPGLGVLREFGKTLLALKVTADAAKDRSVQQALQAYGISESSDGSISEVKRRLIQFSAKVHDFVRSKKISSSSGQSTEGRG